MLSRTVNQIAQSPWAKLAWAGIAVVAMIQVVVLYRLCTTQMERAHARETKVVEQRNAMSDCLDYLHKSTISSCALQARTSNGESLAARDMPRMRAANNGILSSAVPVSYVFH